MMTIDHFETLFNCKYLRWFDLAGQPALVRITKVHKSVEMRMPDGEECKKAVIELEQVNGKIEEVKDLVMNKTNIKTIAEILGPKVSEWHGKEIVLYPTETKVGRELKNCIRIRPPKQKAKQ